MSRSDRPVDSDSLFAMSGALAHRGPDEANMYVDGAIGFGFRRLSIMDVNNGSQPFFSSDGSVFTICNGEIFNFKELRSELEKRGYVFRTNCDIEVVVPLYLEYGKDFLKRLNGQFAIAIYDKRTNVLLLARDHFGICPLFFAKINDGILFGSEIKALLKYPGIVKAVNLTGLDQVFSFPGLVSPQTMFENIFSLKPGSCLTVENGIVTESLFWDLDYPAEDFAYPVRTEDSYIDELESLLLKSVRYRLNADVPVGFYLSGGLDSSLIGAMMGRLNPSRKYNSFSVTFPNPANKDIDESYFQNLVSSYVGSNHHSIPFDWQRVNEGMQEMVFHSECPLKETYNVCSIALSRSVKEKGLKVILSGEGADEFFGGYVGYRFDVQRHHMVQNESLEELLEQQENKLLWGDSFFFYEKNYYDFNSIKKSIYSPKVAGLFPKFNSHSRLAIDKSKLAGRAALHKRSYLDLKLRLSDHLISDHCDRTCYANSVEGRYPFLDIDLIEFVRSIPPTVKLKDLTEKYVLRKVAERYLPRSCYARQKQGFVAPGSPALLRNNIEWVNDMLSSDSIARQGYFDHKAIERIKSIYRRDDFQLNMPFDSDLLIVVLTFNMMLEIFNLPNL